MIAGWITSHLGRGSWQYSLEVVVEETMEMLGVVLFIRALLAYVADGVWTFRVQRTGSSPAGGACPPHVHAKPD